VSYDPEPQIRSYLELLDGELRALPRARRRELVAEIAEHIHAAQEESPVTNEAELRTLLDRIGDPVEIAADAGARVGAARRPAVHEVAAIVLLLLGGFVVGVGWIVGVILLWSSAVWTRRDKLVGTFLVPGGLATSLFVLLVGVGSETCTTRYAPAGGGPATTCTGGHSFPASIALGVLAAVAVLGPIATTFYLGLALSRRRAGAQ